MNVEQGRGNLQRLFAAHDGSVQESLENIIRTSVGRSEQLLYILGSFGAATGFIVYNTQGIALTVHTVDGTTDIQCQFSLRSFYFHDLVYRFFHTFHGERSILQVVAQQLAEIGCNHFGIDKLRTIIFRPFCGENVEELFFESCIYIIL